MLNKILRVTLKIKDYVEANCERLEKIESLINLNSKNTSDVINEVGTENIFLEYFPIKNEEQLNEFEVKLSEKTFRFCVVSTSLV